MNHVPPIRTEDPTMRALQWARVTELTARLGDGMEEIKVLRSYLAAAKNFQAWTWHVGNEDADFLRSIENRIKRGADALKMATDVLSSIQSELMALQTALDDNYERQD